jgi:3-phosphoglycerate kinase
MRTDVQGHGLLLMSPITCSTPTLQPQVCNLKYVFAQAGCYGLDIGPQTAATFEEAILSCKTVFWNGPMGRFEVPGFAAGTRAVATAMGQATAAGSTTVVGGEVAGQNSARAVKRRLSECMIGLSSNCLT